MFPGFELLTDLDLSDNQLDSSVQSLLATCKNMSKLSLENAFHPDATFSLSFLSPMSETLTELTLTLPAGPLDFGVLGQMSRLEKLTLHDASSLDSNRRPETITKQQLSQLSKNQLRWLSLSHFDLPSIDHDTLKGFKGLQLLSLSSCQIGFIQPGALKDRCPLLHHLDLSCNQISELTENMFDSFPLLTKLDLRCNELCKLSPGCFRGLSKLQELNLRCNRLRDLPSAAFNDLVNLRKLNLASNQLSLVTRDLFKPLQRLTRLSLSQNPIESIEDDSFASCKDIFSLSLSHCKLKAIHNRMFTGLCDSLVNLHLDNNLINSFQIKTDDGESVEIKNANMTRRELEMAVKYLFAGFRSLLRLELQHNQFTKLDLKVFGHLRNLTILDLSSNKIDQLNDQAFERMFGRNGFLDLSKNQLTKISRAAFPVGVRLNLKDNPFREYRPDLSAPIEVPNSYFDEAMIAAMFKSETKPPVVELEGIAHLFEGIDGFLFPNSQPGALKSLFDEKSDVRVDLERISELHLNNCYLKSLDQVAAAIWTCDLEDVDLSGNLLDRLDTNLTTYLIEMKSLVLHDNLIESLDDATVFADCPKLEKLDLSKNRLRSINRLLLHGLHILKKLNLSANPQLSVIDDCLFRSLFNVTEIKLCGNNIKQLNLPKLFKSCRRLTLLDLSNNELDNRTFNRESMSELIT